jgi:hypothetical protein
LVSGRLSVLVTVAGLLKGLEPAGRAQEVSHLEDTSAKLEAVRELYDSVDGDAVRHQR